MTKNIRVYTAPNESTWFDRYDKVNSAVQAAEWAVGIFGDKPSKVQLFKGEGWALHLHGPWGRAVVTGDFTHVGEVEDYVKEVCHG